MTTTTRCVCDHHARQHGPFEGCWMTGCDCKRFESAFTPPGYIPVAALREVVAQLDAEHRLGIQRISCHVCRYSPWPCTTRLIADELRALIGDES